MDEEMRSFLFGKASVIECFGAWPTASTLMRNDFKRNSKLYRQWIYANNELTRRQRKNHSHFQLHHIMPISLGGNNDITNIVLCEPNLHLAIHQFIDAQEKPFRGNKRHLSIPCQFVGTIWTMEIK